VEQNGDIVLKYCAIPAPLLPVLLRQCCGCLTTKGHFNFYFLLLEVLFLNFFVLRLIIFRERGGGDPLQKKINPTSVWKSPASLVAEKLVTLL
jgi:hypothetical protein